MSLEALNKQVLVDLSYIGYAQPTWVKPRSYNGDHVYDVVIIGGGQSGLSAAFGLLKEGITNILILDENKKGFEGPWITYARMRTLRTPKDLPSIELGVPSLSFQSWWTAQYGIEGFDKIDKIPRTDWMKYLKWYREILSLPVENNVRVTLIEPIDKELNRISVKKASTYSSILARKVVLATGIQGGGEWHTPALIKDNLPKSRYAHTSETIDFSSLKGKKVGILGGGASAFDNANFALASGIREAHVFARRKELPRINPMRKLESSGIISRFHTLSDHDKYAVMSHFFKFNQPPTNDTFTRASSKEGFHLHLGSPWLEVQDSKEGIIVKTPHQEFIFDYLIISTGLVTDPALRPELKIVEPYITRWGDIYKAHPDIANKLIDLHPYLTPEFSFVANCPEGVSALYGIFAFNYSALISNGVSASALSGLRFAVPKLVKGIADELFKDDQKKILQEYFDYDQVEFVADLQITKEIV